MTPDEEARLRQRLWITRLTRALAHERVVRQTYLSRRLHEELHVVETRSRRLRRRARWLLTSGRPLPRTVASR